MNEIWQVEFCIDTARQIVSKTAPKAALPRDDDGAFATFFGNAERHVARTALRIKLSESDDPDFFQGASQELTVLKAELDGLVEGAWPPGDEGAKVARLYLRLYSVMLENPETFTAL